MKHEILCRENRTGRYKEPSDLGINNPVSTNTLRLYELKLKLEICKRCDDYVTMNGREYCLQSYNEVARRL